MWQVSRERDYANQTIGFPRHKSHKTRPSHSYHRGLPVNSVAHNIVKCCLWTDPRRPPRCLHIERLYLQAPAEWRPCGCSHGTSMHQRPMDRPPQGHTRHAGLPDALGRYISRYCVPCNLAPAGKCQELGFRASQRKAESGNLAVAGSWYTQSQIVQGSMLRVPSSEFRERTSLPEVGDRPFQRRDND